MGTTSHGESSSSRTGQRTPEYVTWVNMIARCENPATPNFDRYGGRGIRVCERWRHSFTSFVADMGRRPEGRRGNRPAYTLDRKDNDGAYSPENCRWATWEEQMRNTSANRTVTAHGKTMCVAEWADEVGMHHRSITQRIDVGMAPERALDHTPTGKRYVFRGGLASAAEISRATGVPTSSIGRRLARHGDAELAITEWQQNNKGKNRKPKGNAPPGSQELNDDEEEEDAPL